MPRRAFIQSLTASCAFLIAFSAAPPAHAAPGDDTLAPSGFPADDPPPPDPAEVVETPTGKLAPKHFADAGTNVISGWSNLGFSYSSFSNTGYTNTGFQADLGFDRFVTNGVSLGGFVAYSTETSKRTGEITTKSRNVGVRLGLAHAFSDVTAIWLRMGLTLGGLDQTGSDGFGRYDDHETYFAAQVEAPLLVQPVQHLFVGFGPILWMDFTRSIERYDGPERRRFYIGGSLIVGGWF